MEILLLRLGLTPNYKGFHLLCAALTLLERNPDALLLVTKRLYPVLGKATGLSWQSAERNLRTAAAVIWRRSPDYLQQLAGFPLTRCPTVTQLLAILHLSHEAQ